VVLLVSGGVAPVIALQDCVHGKGVWGGLILTWLPFCSP
jgi:hypothetical protein